MHGFFCSIGKSVSFNTSVFGSTMIRRKIKYELFQMEQVTIPKFENDKAFIDTDECFFATEGMILNADELLDQYHQSSLNDLIPYMYSQRGDRFYNEFRGSFCGVYYDKIKKKCIFYNDHIGDRLLFFSHIEGTLLISSDLQLLNCAMKNAGFRTTINEVSVRMMLGFSYLLPGYTLLNDVHRIGAGESLTINVDNNFTYKLEQYHQFQNTSVKNVSEHEAIENIDQYFRKAVGRILRKNIQYGYDHYASLSAGLDSRMTTWVMRDMTNDDIYNVTYSQTGYYDETTSKDIAKYLGNTMLFTPLNGGEHLRTEFDNMLNITEGLVNYGGSAEALHVLSSYADTNIGCLATGMAGDVVINTHIKNNKANGTYNANYASITSNSFLLKSHLPYDFYTKYPSKEIFFLYNRVFCCSNMGTPTVIQPYSESYSPFLDTDFLDYVYSIPVEMRFNYNIYDKWILSKYPEAALWKHNGVNTIGNRMHRQISIHGRDIELKDLPKRLCWFILKKLHIANMYKTIDGHSMSPEDSWINDNPELRSALDEIFKENIHVLDQFRDLQKVATNMYYNGVAQEKEIVITAVRAISRLMK